MPSCLFYLFSVSVSWWSPSRGPILIFLCLVSSGLGLILGLPIAFLTLFSSFSSGLGLVLGLPLPLFGLVSSGLGLVLGLPLPLFGLVSSEFDCNSIFLFSTIIYYTIYLFF